MMSVLSKIEKSFGSAREAGEKFKAVMSGVASETESAGAAATRAAPKMGKFTQSILRVAKYRMIRAALRAVVDAVKEGAENFYNFSASTGEALVGYATAVNSVKAATSQMKNQLGAAFGTLYAQIAPIIVSLVNMITNLANVLTMLFARLSGASGWYKATAGANDLADAVGGAGSAAKEAMKYLAPFDELNRLPADNKSGGGGGGGSTDGGGGGYEWVEFEQFDIGDGFAAIFDGLKDILNNASEWIENIDWQDLPRKVVTGIADAFSKVDWAGVTQAIARFLGAAIGAVGGMIAGIADLCGGILESIYNYFHNDDGSYKSGEEIILGIYEGIKGALTNAWNWIKENIFTPFMDGLKKAFGIASPAKEMEDPGEDIGKGILEGIAKPFIKIGEWINEHILQPIKDFFSDLTGGPVIELGVSLVKKGWETVSGWFSGLGAKATTAWATIQTWLDKAKDSKWGWTTVQGWLDGLGEKVSTGWAKAQVWLDKAKDSKWGWTTITDWVKEKAGEGWAKAQVYLARTTQGDYKWSSITSWVKEKAGEGWAKAQVYLARTTSGDYKWTSITSWVKEKAGEGWAKALVYLARATSGEYSWSSITSWISEKYGDGWARALVYLRKATGDEAWTTVAVWVSGFMGGTVNKAIGLARNAWTSVAQWIESNDLIGGVVSIGVALVQSGWSSIKNWLSGLAGTLGISVQFNAGGGAFYSNSWHSIPQYAGGTSNAHGSMFIAGEAGPEVVGHIGGRTEVLNKSQLAATMYSAVRSAMASVSFRMGGMPSVGFDSAAMEEVMYSAFVRAMNDTEADETIVLDGDVLYSKMLARNRAATYRMGSNPMMSMA